MRSAWILRRLLSALPLALGIVLLTFFLLRLMPGDPVDIMMGSGGNVSTQEVEGLRHALGLDQPLFVQMGRFASHLAAGDLGTGLRDRRPVTALISETLPATLELSLVALLLAVLLSLPVGVISAVRARGLFDRVAMTGSFFGISMPAFWLGLVLILIFAVGLHWLPTSDRLDAGVQVPGITHFVLIDTLLAGNFAAFVGAVKHLILPACTLAAELTAILSRVIRSSMLDARRMDYVRTARAKGVAEWKVVIKHTLRNALTPAVSVLGLQIGVLLGGNMIVETVFGWPGLGRLVVGAIFSRDYAVVQGAVLLYALTFLLANLLVDVLYTLLNPKVSV